MRGTTSSSQTLLTVTRTESSLNHAYNGYVQRSRRSSLISCPPPISPMTLIVAALLVLSWNPCDAKRVAGGVGDKSVNSFHPGYAGAPSGTHRQSNVQHGKLHDEEIVNHDTDEYYIDEKKDDVKTIRYVNDKKKPEGGSKKSKEGHHKRHHHHSNRRRTPPPNPIMESDQHAGDNEFEVQVNVKKGKGSNRNLNAGGNANTDYDMTFPEPEIHVVEPLGNNAKKPLFDSHVLKKLAEDVADSILAEADRLYNALESGAGVAYSGDITSTSALSSNSDFGEYVVCQ